MYFNSEPGVGSTFGFYFKLDAIDLADIDGKSFGRNTIHENNQLVENLVQNEFNSTNQVGGLAQRVKSAIFLEHVQ